MRFLPMVFILQVRQMFGLRGLWIGLIRLDIITLCKFVLVDLMCRFVAVGEFPLQDIL
jgi:hypothetical protein